GGSQHDPVGRSGTVDSCSGRSLKNLDVFDVRRVEVGQRIGRTSIPVTHRFILFDLDTIDDVQWLIATIQGTDPTNIYRNTPARLTGILGDIYPRCSALDSLFDRGIDGTFDVICPDGDLSGGQIAPFHLSVSYYHHFIEQFSIGHHNQIHSGPTIQ